MIGYVISIDNGRVRVVAGHSSRTRLLSGEHPELRVGDQVEVEYQVEVKYQGELIHTPEVRMADCPLCERREKVLVELVEASEAVVLLFRPPIFRRMLSPEEREMVSRLQDAIAAELVKSCVAKAKAEGSCDA